MLCNRHNAPDKLNALCFDLAHKLPVDLHIVERIPTDKIEVAVVRAEVINRELDPFSLQGLEDDGDVSVVAQKKAFG
ncbi:hypothetical protein NLI96_g13216 [Meripilus lineatus]|uniref:Uncharacterized protein n=1 Tax=Meripilus lineatus TaxID=2056292 RepID=A0AAD5YBP5_9APHY|nr:hypothetical protein NLI96_g13216 [Physisporinus lineatus]